MNTLLVALLFSASAAGQTQAPPASINLQTAWSFLAIVNSESTYEVLVIAGLLIALVLVCLWLGRTIIKYRALSKEHESVVARFRPVIDLEVEKQRVVSELEAERRRLREGIEQIQDQQTRGEAELRDIQVKTDKLREELASLDEEATLQSFGFYKPRYDFASSEQYQSAIEKIRESQKAMISNKTAAICHIAWEVNGSRVEGRKQINQTLKLMLRAFNGECDAAIAKVKYNNMHVMEARILKSVEIVNKLAGVQQCYIAQDYLNLKLQELYLVHEYQEKVQEEKEEQRRIREQMREEEIARREIERALQEAEKDEGRYAEALRRAREEVEKAVGEKQQKLYGQIEELQRKLSEAQANRERAIARAQMTRSGHVYVISNIGSFGDDVFKIGLTRRLDPLDRVRELGDASVPFQFDVHAMIYSEDAPGLETKLHQIFNHRRANLVNERKEFFRVAIEEIAEVVSKHDASIRITHAAEAVEYRKTIAIRQDNFSKPERTPRLTEFTAPAAV
jgi:uncharacterized protein DUF4041/Meiotically Up-regulated Gene 113 (MUG113) protein